MPTHPIPIVHLDFEVIPDNVFMTNGQPFPGRGSMRPVTILPGETFVLHTSDFAAMIDRVPERKTGLLPKRIFIIKELFYFADGMRWGGNLYSVPDPEFRGRFIRQDPLSSRLTIRRRTGGTVTALSTPRARYTQSRESGWMPTTRLSALTHPLDVVPARNYDSDYTDYLKV